MLSDPFALTPLEEIAYKHSVSSTEEMCILAGDRYWNEENVLAALAEVEQATMRKCAAICDERHSTEEWPLCEAASRCAEDIRSAFEVK